LSIRLHYRLYIDVSGKADGIEIVSPSSLFKTDFYITYL